MSGLARPAGLKRTIAEIFRFFSSVIEAMPEILIADLKRKKIKHKPSVYLGKPSISCIQAFLSGYNVAQYQLGLPLQQENPLDGFQDWIQKKFNIDSSQSWANIILFFSQDERDALDIFFSAI